MKKVKIAAVLFKNNEDYTKFLKDNKCGNPEVKIVGYVELDDNEDFNVERIWSMCYNHDRRIRIEGDYSFVATSSLAFYNQEENEWYITKLVGFKKVHKEVLEVTDFINEFFFPSFEK